MLEMKVAALFGGQGSQYPGMGKALYEESEEVRDIYACASDIFGFDVAKKSFEDDAEELSRTAIAQPVVFTHSLAAFTVAWKYLPTPDLVAGHSLGEYSALCCAGAFSIEDGFRIIAARARAMEEVAQTAPGTMVAITGSDEETIKAVCEKHGRVWAVNFNLPNQTVISGEVAACLAAADELTSIGAKATRLSVGSAFHTPMMQSAADEFKKQIEGISYSDPICDFYSNLTGDILHLVNYPDYFARHMVSPVLFTRQIEAISHAGIDICIEYGPKKTASTLAKKNNRQLRVMNMEDMASLQKTLEEIGPNAFAQYYFGLKSAVGN